MPGVQLFSAVTTPFRRLPGLPPYGPLATAFPPKWGCLGREGLVVSFETEEGEWVANFQPGLGGVDVVWAHPNGHDIVVIASGDLWVVNPELRSAELLLGAIDRGFQVDDPLGLVLSIQGIAWARLGPQGLEWHTRRLSWDGFDELRIVGDQLVGLAWSALDHKWRPFQFDLRTGRSSGGTFSDRDVEGWERLLDGRSSSA